MATRSSPVASAVLACVIQTEAWATSATRRRASATVNPALLAVIAPRANLATFWPRADAQVSHKPCDHARPIIIYLMRWCAGCDDSCTGVLLDDFEALTTDLSEKAGQLETAEIAPPWGLLDEVRIKVTELEDQLTQRRLMLDRAASFNLHSEEVLLKATRREVRFTRGDRFSGRRKSGGDDMLWLQAKRIEETSVDTKARSLELVGLANELQEEVEATRKNIEGMFSIYSLTRKQKQ